MIEKLVAVWLMGDWNSQTHKITDIYSTFHAFRRVRDIASPRRFLIFLKQIDAEWHVVFEYISRKSARASYREKIKKNAKKVLTVVPFQILTSV